MEKAFAPESVSVLLEDDIDISRGDFIVSAGHAQPQVSQGLTMMCCWFNEQELQLHKRYIVRNTVSESVGMVKSVDFRLDINNLEHIEGVVSLKMNDIAQLTLRLAQPMVFDRYVENRTTGSLIMIDPDSFETVGAGMII